jgi:hypothetical protein
MERLVHYVFGLVFAAGGLLALPGGGQAGEGFGERVAGTYFVEHSSGAFRVITLNSDGGLSAIASSQGGSVFEGVEFTSQQGTWQQSGAKALIATVIDFNLGTDTTGGTVVATYELSFGRGFDTVEGVITLLNFAPGVNPFADDAEPITDPVESTVEGSRVEPGTLRP